MRPLPGFAKARRRSGKGLLPPNPKQWEIEHNGLDVRDELGLELIDPLDHNVAFGLLPNVTVQPHGAIPAADKYLEHFRKDGLASLSGFALTLPGGAELVVYNDAHPLNRVRATLMEEFFHIRLGHPRSAVRLYSERDEGRTYDAAVEDEAYQSGAAALVPYRPLKQLVDAGDSPPSIARQFRVSVDLVVFRTKVCRCYRRGSRGRR